MVTGAGVVMSAVLGAAVAAEDAAALGEDGVVVIASGGYLWGHRLTWG